MKCNYCGTEFDGNFCTECGKPAEKTQNFDNANVQQQPAEEPIMSNFAMPSIQQMKKKKPFYKRWWFIVLAVVVVLGGFGKLLGGRNSRLEKIEWSKMELGSYLPEPSSNKGKIWNNTNEELDVDLKGVSKDDYSEYVKSCEEKGYNVDSEKTDWSYDAYNEGGYKLRLSLIEETMYINLNAPMKFKTIEWPESTVGKLLPAPKSLTGNFNYEHDTSFFVYIGETTEEDYNQYVKACSNAGFNVDYDKGDTYYYAYNTAGYHVSVEYEGNNIMSISIKSPDNTSSKDSAETEPAPSTEEDQAETKKDDTNLVNGMRKEFKDAMDSYEKSMDEYVAFMKKYSNNPNDVSLLTDYTRYLTNYTDMCSKFEKWENEGMNDAETMYYIEVQTRVNKKLLEVSQ